MVIQNIYYYYVDPNECFEFDMAFDYAEKFQTPIMVLSDLDIGMNDWVVDQFKWDDNYSHDRGKLVTSEDIEKLNYLRYEMSTVMEYPTGPYLLPIRLWLVLHSRDITYRHRWIHREWNDTC